jgi:heat shock protein HtpX
MSIYSQITENNVKTVILLTGFVVLLTVVAWVFAQAFGYDVSFVGIALFISLILSFGSYFWGDKLVLAMSGARPANRQEDFDFFTVAENLSIAAGIPKPKLYVIDDTAMNAFATGRDPEHAVVVATKGILAKLDRRELEGVIAHELSHVKNFDIRVMLIVTVLAGTIAFLADWFMRSLWWGGGMRRRRNNDDNRGGEILVLLGIVFAILSPLVATVIKLAVSRQREYLADASGALLTRYPEGLARALEKLKADREVLEAATNATAHLYITNPFKGKDFGAWFSGLFDTHPPIDERIKRLRAS